MKLSRSAIVGGAGVLAAVAFLNTAQAQSADALIDKLVENGILTTKEAKDLREDAKKDFDKNYRKETSMPEWVNSLKFSGDFRGRFEKHNMDNTLANDRNRFRYRARFGVTASLLDNFEIGLRLASANPVGGFGGNPVSANTDLSDGASRKFVYVDAAYAKWTPIHSGPWLASAAFGKMDNPFALSPMVFDPDYQPEGFAVQGGYNFSGAHALKFNSGLFILDEFNQGPSASRDPFVFGGQLLLGSKWLPKIETALTLAAFGFGNKDNLSNTAAPNVNDGNTRTPGGVLAYDYYPAVAGGSFTYKFSSAPLYKAEFPVKVAGEYMKNPGAPAQNHGWWAGVTLGKAGHKGLWDISYKYQRLEADAWYEEFPDDDNGGYYEAGPTGSGNGAGYRGGTNVKGHILKANYSLTDSCTFTLTYYLTELIDPFPTGSISSSGHLLVDFMWKF